jgi:predicted RNA polymerase sigma factor
MREWREFAAGIGTRQLGRLDEARSAYEIAVNLDRRHEKARRRLTALASKA